MINMFRFSLGHKYIFAKLMVFKQSFLCKQKLKLHEFVNNFIISRSKTKLYWNLLKPR